MKNYFNLFILILFIFSACGENEISNSSTDKEEFEDILKKGKFTVIEGGFIYSLDAENSLLLSEKYGFEQELISESFTKQVADVFGFEDFHVKSNGKSNTYRLDVAYNTPCGTYSRISNSARSGGIQVGNWCKKDGRYTAFGSVINNSNTNECYWRRISRMMYPSQYVDEDSYFGVRTHAGVGVNCSGRVYSQHIDN